MSKADEPAFPWSWKDFQPTTGEQVTREQGFGLTKREWFAGMAMQGLLASWPENSQVVLGNTAKQSLMFADALLAELSKGVEHAEATEKE